ncbi:hypothetical protein J31TS4_26960 [Paenibacillus sp. J31TS4]|uniref:class I SAM-dependent methyltransferase n=1 Tax=Paenibacillus sp. J31TS4 TaxID=2807195 RepID=UPI001B27C062|nr:class I SAM-dependent methyltransferase [Paenibacillus sp. J31TS4]GIP39416.1 hypothetical protein J31TS4_26960 [Paenibacillus sp. J31TS4]
MSDRKAPDGRESADEWKELTDESRDRWDRVAGFWDDYMGETSNRWHRELIRPKTEELLAVKPGDRVLDVACGNGNFSRRLADLGAQVTAFDYSPVMVERARRRSQEYEARIEYRVADATEEETLLALGRGAFDSAVANMALMDIADIRPLIRSATEWLKPGGVFVFSVPHPCFQSPQARRSYETEDIDGRVVSRSVVHASRYLTPQASETIGIAGQPIAHLLFHRSLQEYMTLFFGAGFVLDGFAEPGFAPDPDSRRFEWSELPAVAVFRFRKLPQSGNEESSRL